MTQAQDGVMLTSLGRPDRDHLVGFVQLAETLSEHLYVIRGVRFQHSQFVAGLVAVSVHTGPLLRAHKSEDKRRDISTSTASPRGSCVLSRCTGVLMAEKLLPVVDDEVAGVEGKVLGTRPGQSDAAQKVWRPLEVLDLVGQRVH